MTKEEGAIIMAYTGIAIGSMSAFHRYAEKLLDRPIFTHEFSCKETLREIKRKSFEDFVSLHDSINKE